MTIVLYGHRLSQPSRAVEILLLELGVPYRFHEVAFAEGETREPWFLKLNPSHTIPTLLDDDERGQQTEEGFVISESHAIMRYLCRKFGRGDPEKEQWYPPEKEQHRQRLTLIDQHLDWHPARIRRFDMFHCIMSIHLIPSPMLKREHFEETLRPLQDSLLSSLVLLESFLETRNPAASSLSSGGGGSIYLCGGSHPSIADLTTACELLQIASVGYSFSPRFPRVSLWLETLASRASFQQVSQKLQSLGQEINASSSKWLNLSAFSSPQVD